MIIQNVLTGKRNFDIVYRRGKSLGDKYVVIFYKKNDIGSNRIAFLASKKVGNAVKRNRARRLMKQAFRDMNDIYKSGWDIIFIARNTIEDKKCYQVKKSMESALKRGGLKI